MKIFPKIGLLLLMLLLVAGAFILPKFVQRAVPPTPKEDLAAALAAVEISSGTKPEEEPTESGLRDNPDYEAFFKSLDASDFESARESLLGLSERVDSETIESLTIEMEKAVKSLATTGKPVPPAEAPPSVLSGMVSISPTEPEAEVDVIPEYDPEKTIEIMALIQKNEFAEVEARIAAIKEIAPTDTILLLENSLSSAIKNQKDLEASRLEAIKSREEMNKLQRESMAQIRESVTELKEATLSANRAIKEVTELKQQLTTEPAGVESVEKAGTAKKAPAPPEIPKTTEITFGFDSTQLDTSSRKILTEASALLKAEPRLKLQLRGYADPSGSSEYNAILAKARGETAKDFLIENEIAPSRVSVISFGETRSENRPSSPENARRVDLIFRSE